MRTAPWEPLGLTEDEWRDCETSAREMTLATGARVSARQVAVEFALARAFDDDALLAPTAAAPAWSAPGRRAVAR